MRRLLKPLFIALGLLCLALGTLGIFLPVLPTTPLYLATLFCFARGSERMHNWFVGTKLYKKYLDRFVRERSLPLRTKMAICIPVSTILIITIYFAPIWHLQVLIVVLMLIKWYFFIFKIKTSPSGGTK
jgi:uncharacterized membrane protein YbaN (DUF454 family)